MSEDGWIARERERIMKSDVVGFMINIAAGKRMVSPQQLRACEVLLKKIMPDATAAGVGSDLPNVSVTLGPNVDTVAEWLALIREQRLHERHGAPGNGTDRSRVVQLTKDH
jgi:hypothetical protein